MTLLAVYMYVGLFRQTHKKRHANKYPNTLHRNTFKLHIHVYPIQSYETQVVLGYYGFILIILFGGVRKYCIFVII